MRYQASYTPIDTITYCHLRQAAGLSPKTAEAAAAGLPRSVCAVAVHDLEQDTVVGMGRIIGDGACFCQIVDICVLPEHQKRGLGKLIMEQLMAFVHQSLPASCYISLIADGEAYRLYEQYGFREVYPRSRGMGLVKA